MRSEELKQKWEEVIQLVSERFGEGEKLDLDAVLFLIGVQELGQGFRKFKKDEKINLLHIAICRVLAPFGYYELEGLDPDGWPHYKLLAPLPSLKAGEQTILMKEAVVTYFEENGWIVAR